MFHKICLHHPSIKQAANYEMLHTGERNSYYSLMKKYEGNLVNHNIKTESKAKLRKLIRDEFNTIWQTQIISLPKADT